jgi:hypothetical protein
MYNGNSNVVPYSIVEMVKHRQGIQQGITALVLPGPFTSSNESGCVTLRFRVIKRFWVMGYHYLYTMCARVMVNEDGYGSLKQQILCADPIDHVINIGPKCIF